MITIPISSFLDGLRHGPLLAPDQMRETERVAAALPTSQAVAAELARRGWLTNYQAAELSAGRGFGLIFGPYVLLEKLGEGGMGEVFRARHRLLGREAAVKRMLPHLLSRTDLVERFLREGRAAARLSHPNVVPIHDVADVDGVYYLAMEYLRGSTLEQRLERRGCLKMAKAVEYVRQACEGMQHAHERGMIHRDLKPANLMLTERRLVVILDMGLARLANEGPLTQPGEFFGTIEYAAPEQVADARSVDVRADIYSLGCVLYELLTGRVPLSFKGVPWKDRLARLKHEPRPISEFRGEVPPQVEAIVRKMIARRPEDRYQTPGAAAAALGALVRRRSGERPGSDSDSWKSPVPQEKAPESSFPPTEPARELSLEVEIALPGRLCMRRLAAEGWEVVGRTPGRYRIDAALEYGLKIDDKASDEQLQDLAGLRSVPSLQALDLSWCERLTDAELDLLRPLKALQALHLGKCSRVTDEGVRSLAALSSLQTLSLHGCEQVTDEGLEHLRGLPALQALSLGDSLWDCEAVTDAGLGRLRALSSLVVLDLRGCKRVTDEGLAHLRALSSLRVLNLRGCDRVSDAGLEYLRSLRSLRSLSLVGCRRVTDAGLAHLRVLPLRVLSLAQCEKVTDAGLEHLQALSHLKELDLRGCDGVTDAGARALGQALPRCAVTRRGRPGA